MDSRIPILEWSEAYCLGIDKMDSGIAVLYCCLSELLVAADYEFGARVVGNALSLFEAQAAKHFALEEALMVELSYPDFEEHRRHHRYFIHRLSEMRQGYDADREISRESLSFCANWITGHVLAMDRMIGEFARTIAFPNALAGQGRLAEGWNGAEAR